MLQPMSDWFWFSENGQLMLSMGSEWQCTTAYGQKEIIDLPTHDTPFSLNDAESYLTLANSLQASCGKFSEAELTHILINATAAMMFHKPVAPKSWLFDEVESYGNHHSLASVSNQFNNALVVVLTDEHPLATCMVISNRLQINEKRFVNQFSLIKVAKNRLVPQLTEWHSQLSA